MGWWSKLVGLPEGPERLPDPTTENRSEQPPTWPSEVAIKPPSRSDRLPINQDKALTLIPVYRSFALISGAVSQLTIDLWRGDASISSQPTWVRRPDVKIPRSAFFELTTTSLAATGNAFWRVERDSPADAPSALLVMDPHEVTIHEDGSFTYRSRDLKRWQVQHLALMRIPGRQRGLGPIQAASQDLTGAADLRDYASNWFHAGTVPNGVLQSEQHITEDQAKAVKTQWLNSVSGSEPAVLGQGLDYKPFLLSPKDAQFLESRQFTTTDIARLFGIPSHLMLAVVEGGSMTYLNGQAADLSFLRWTLMPYLREIEEAFTALLPRGQTARFNVDAILRPSTKERYEAHQLALEAGFLTVDEVRDIEGLNPLPASAPPSEEAS